MSQTYLDWATTSLAPHPVVSQKVSDYLSNLHSTNSATRNLELAFQTRQHVAKFFNAKSPMEVVLTSNVTQSLNMVLNGLLKKGDHVITTSIEHNAVARPLHLLEERLEIDVTYLPCEVDGHLNVNLFQKAIRPSTRLVVMTHASNVLGTIMPVKEIFKIAKENNLLTVLDTAQSAGFLPVDCQEMSIDILCFTGHKSLLAMQGSGGFIVKTGVEDEIEPWLVGGTGSLSESLTQPDFMPDKFESGTKNYPAIISLGESLELLRSEKDSYQHHEEVLTQYFIQEMKNLPVRLIGPTGEEKRVPLVSIVPENMTSADLHLRLQEDYAILTRYGLHCSPLAHRTANSYDTGAVRFSFGYSTTQDEIDYAVRALSNILGKKEIE